MARHSTMKNSRRSVVVLLSGNGSNLQALIDSSPGGDYRIVGVISNKEDAYGLCRARLSNINSTLIDHRHYESRELFDQALAKAIDNYQPGLIVLAGFMRILGASFVKRYQGQILNIHPSLLPAYPGINTNQRVLHAGEEEHGVSVHFVTEELDGGPVIFQESIKIDPADTVESLTTKIHRIEHGIYPTVVSWFAAGRVRLESNKAFLDDQLLPACGAEINS